MVRTSCIPYQIRIGALLILLERSLQFAAEMTGRGEQRGAAAAALFLLLALGVHAQFLLAARDLGLLRGARIRFGDVVVDDAAAAWARVRASPLAAVPLTTVAEAKTMRWAKARASDETEVSVALVLHHGEWRVVEANLTGIEVETVLRVCLDRARWPCFNSLCSPLSAARPSTR